MTTTEAARREAVPVGSAEYNEILSFLYHEALLLDRCQYEEWVGLLAEDLRYEVPVRQSQMLDKGTGFSRDIGYFSENHATLTMRVKRLQTDMAWAEQPNTRTRRIVGNVLVDSGDAEGEYLVTSAVIIARSRLDLRFDFLTGERVDVLRRTAAGLRIAKRTFFLDEAVLHMHNLSIFF